MSATGFYLRIPPDVRLITQARDGLVTLTHGPFEFDLWVFYASFGEGETEVIPGNRAREALAP